MALGIETASVAALEERMEPTPSKTSKTEPEATALKASKGKSSKKQEPAAQPKPKREKIPAEDVCVFAFRLSTTERTRIHEAAGGGKASQFVLAAALAAADGDGEAFKKVVATRDAM